MEHKGGEHLVNKNMLLSEMVSSGFNQKSMASAIGMSKNTFCLKINGHNEFNADEIMKICDVLNITSCDKKVAIFLS